MPRYDLISQLGGTWSEEHAEQLVGNSLLDSGSYILNAIGRVDLSPAWVVEQLLTAVVDHIRRHPIVWRPGRSSCSTPSLRQVFLAHWYRRRTGCCWTRPSANCPRDTFQVSVAGDEVSRGKPHPEPYEKACTALGVSARHCVVLEDSETGCRAGNAAGALVVAVPNRVEIPKAPRRLHGVPSLTWTRLPWRCWSSSMRIDPSRARGVIGGTMSDCASDLSRRRRLAPRERARLLLPLLLLLSACRTPGEQPAPTPTEPDAETVHGDVDRPDPSHRSAAITDAASTVLSLNVFQRLMTADPEARF